MSDKTTVEMTQANFEDLIHKNEIVMIDFWAEWCGPCKMFGPIFEKSAAKHKDIVFAKVDTENQQGLAASFNVRSIPTLGIFRDGILLFLQPGLVPEEALDELVEQVKGLDMEKVREDIAKQESKQATSQQ